MTIKTDQTNEVREFLGQIPLFADLSSSSMQRLSALGKFIHFEKGEFIFLQSDPSENYYIVHTGLVSIHLESPDGREMVINEMRPGDSFGELGILTEGKRSASAFARLESDLLVFSRIAFLQTIEEEPILARRILAITAERLRNSSERESALAFLDAQARLARLLLQMDRHELQKGYFTISQDELAQRTGMTRQTVAKTLGRWRRSGWLITGRGHILLLNRSELNRLEKEWLLSG
jgi:CRP-like cAMP-binding protein